MGLSVTVTPSLAPTQVDLSDLAMALEDHSEEHSWWLNAATGRVNPHFHSAPAGEPQADLVRVEPLPTAVGYADMEEFVTCVRDPRARDLLERAIAGRGAFRRFKDTLIDYPALRSAWFAFHDARGELRAIEWLARSGIIEPEAAAQELARRGDVPAGTLPGLLDAGGVARRVADELKRVYRQRLEGVLVVGPWARVGPHPDAAVTLVVVIDRMSDRWAEKRRMERVLWRHSIRHDIPIVALPLSPEDLDFPVSPRLSRALEEAVMIA